MIRIPKLPLIPGFVVNNNPKKHFHLAQNWNYVDGTTILVEKEHSYNGSKHQDEIFRKPTLYPPHTSPQLPNWIVNDRKILCFSAYFREELQETYTASYHIRQVKILYYLEDGTVQVIERRVNNSGISQGCIVSRQRVPCSPPHQNEFLSILDFNVQQQVTMFDQTYNITSCDDFTRKYLNRAGISVPQPIDTPECCFMSFLSYIIVLYDFFYMSSAIYSDPSQVIRKQMEEMLKPKKPKVPKDVPNKLGKFLEFENRCLRFDAYWDDRNSLNGDIRELIVLYYLCDDTIQINEKCKENSGRGVPGTFLKRQKLPKAWNGVPLIGQQTNFTVLNVLGGGFMKGRFLQDSLGVGKQNINFYTDRDLKLGETIDAYGRQIVLIDCDKFTQQYYQAKYGIEEFTPLAKPVDKPNKWQHHCAERLLPPFNGWGTHEDSEGNCRTVEPKPPHRDFTKFLKLDRHNLRFEAQMISNIPDNRKRMFVITYYLSDDTVSVFESSGRNSGFRSGDFLKRSKFYLPDQEWFTSGRPKPYTSQHFYIGASICLKDYVFHLINADDFTLNYMEAHPFEYPMSNIEMILSKIKMAIEPIYKDFIAKYLGDVATIKSTLTHAKTYICFATMRKALVDLLGTDITEHEIVTFLRYFSVSKKTKVKPNKCNRNIVQSLVQAELNRNLWDDMARLKEHIYHLDPHNVDGFMPAKQLHSIILACRLPLSSVLIDEMCSVLNKNSNGEIEVNDFLCFIDRFKCKAAPIQPMNPYYNCTRDTFPSDAGEDLIDWSVFIQELGLENNLKQETD